MDTLRDNKEHVYYDLQELTFVPGMADDDYAWVDKVLTLGHPEEWSQGIDYTDHVYNTIAHLYHVYVRLETQQLYNEHRTYQRDHETPEHMYIQVDAAQVEQEMADNQAAREHIIENVIPYAQRYTFESDLSGLLNRSHYSLPGDLLQYVDETAPIPPRTRGSMREINISELAENGRWNWWGEGEDE